MKIRRTSPEVRLEMTPLMDVIFLLLTFFVFSLTLLVRAQVLGVSLPHLSAAQDAAGGAPTITVAIDNSGAPSVNGEPVEIGALIERLRALREAEPAARLLVAADTGAPSGALLDVVDRLSLAGMRDFALVGRPGQRENAPREGGVDDGSDSGEPR